MDSIERTTSFTQKLYWLFYLLTFLLLGIYFQTNQRIILLIMILDFILLGIVYCNKPSMQATTTSHSLFCNAKRACMR